MTLKEMIIKLGLDHPKKPSKVTIRMIEGGGGRRYHIGPSSPGLVAHIEKEYEAHHGWIGCPTKEELFALEVHGCDRYC